MKRTFDLIVSCLGLILLSPLFLTISLLIKLNDKGSIIFKQKRVGKDGILFFMYKFRTMKNLSSAVNGSFEPGDVSRVTSIGKLLRKLKLDEIPQLFNVLKGEMSIVGPRPEVEKWVGVYPRRWERILTVKPGITDNASLLFRDEESILSGSSDPEKTYEKIILPKKLDLYEEYVGNNSFAGDIIIIFRTIFSLLLNRNM